ncbi:MAG: hypothetical protein JWN83_1690 [Chitinophagaceae bacterium]|nr:hypothetical protein [Ferruginibacter sp.]MDB5223023.1 hypothetical protein [Chitinophagaceae bacterium]
MGFFKSLMSVISTDGKTGTPFKLDKNHTVYYKGDGVSKLDAAHVGGFFQGYGYFTETSQSDIQILSNKAGDPLQIGYIIGGPGVSPETEEYFKNAESGLQKFFPERIITFHLLDVNLKQLKTL